MINNYIISIAWIDNNIFTYNIILKSQIMPVAIDADVSVKSSKNIYFTELSVCVYHRTSYL